MEFGLCRFCAPCCWFKGRRDCALGAAIWRGFEVRSANFRESSANAGRRRSPFARSGAKQEIETLCCRSLVTARAAYADRSRDRYFSELRGIDAMRADWSRRGFLIREAAQACSRPLKCARRHAGREWPRLISSHKKWESW